MCHLVPYAKNMVERTGHDTELTRYFSNLKMAVDFLHFKNHVGKNCKEFYTPHQYPELKPVNSVVCEQQFRCSNNKTNVKSMNQERFNHYWLYVIDLHNHSSVGDLRHAVNPTSQYRMELILQDMLKKMSDDKRMQGESNSFDIVDGLSQMTLDNEAEVVIACECTRKCKTKLCVCYKNKVACNPKCQACNWNRLNWNWKLSCLSCERNNSSWTWN